RSFGMRRMRPPQFPFPSMSVTEVTQAGPGESRVVVQHPCFPHGLSDNVGKATKRVRVAGIYRARPSRSKGHHVKHVDVTRAILQALADVHPRGIHSEALACMVHCEQMALRKELRLLDATGAVRCAPDMAEVS